QRCVDAGLVVCMSRHFASETMSGADDGFDFLVRELLFDTSIGHAHHTAGRGQFDHIRAALRLLSYHLAAFIRAVTDTVLGLEEGQDILTIVAVIAMTAG